MDITEIRESNYYHPDQFLIQQDEFTNINTLLARLHLSQTPLSTQDEKTELFHSWHLSRFHLDEFKLYEPITYTDVAFALEEMKSRSFINYWDFDDKDPYHSIVHALFGNNTDNFIPGNGFFLLDPVSKLSKYYQSYHQGRPFHYLSYEHLGKELQNMQFTDFKGINVLYEYLDRRAKFENKTKLTEWAKLGEKIFLDNCFEQYMRHYEIGYLITSMLAEKDPRYLYTLYRAEEFNFDYLRQNYKDSEDYKNEFVKKFIKRIIELRSIYLAKIPII